jgi:hypothetical protein
LSSNFGIYTQLVGIVVPTKNKPYTTLPITTKPKILCNVSTRSRFGFGPSSSRRYCSSPSPENLLTFLADGWDWFRFSAQGDAMHQSAQVYVVERFNRVHRTAVIPHQNIMWLPVMGVNEFLGRCVGDEFVQ